MLLLSRFSRVRLCATPQMAPTRLPCPWDSPGKNTGVGCHCLLQCMKVKSESEVAQSYLTLCDPRDCSPPSSSVHGILQARVLEWGAIAFSMRLSSFLFILFSSCCSVSAVFAILSSSSLLCSAASLILLLVPSNAFHLSFVFIAHCLFFKSSGSLVNICCIFSICDSNHFISMILGDLYYHYSGFIFM